ncbi:MAG: hypothetical protein QG604_304 [Candidatus Dependentiae bacterium]|nr:hypothetical protein [Candidatus Dependentiae bacterium]
MLKRFNYLFLFFILFLNPCNTLAATTAPQHGNLFSHFWGIAETINKIETRAFRTIPLATIVEEGLRAMVNKVDAHSAFFSPRSYQTTVELASGHFPGIGISVISKETDADSLLVVDTMRGGPADLGGIKSGDAIIKIDGQRLRGLTSDEVINKLKGPIDTMVRVTVMREKKPLKFKLIRKLIHDRSVYAYQLPQQNITYIAIKSFSDKTPEHVESFLRTAEKKKSNGIILDMRKNPGGVVEAAVKTAGLFLPDQSVVVRTKNNKKETVGTYTTNGTPLYTGQVPLFVLIDNFTASAAEIVTGCLQHHARLLNLPIFVIGMPSYGKGSVQEVIPLHNGCAIKLTVLLYYLPNEQCIQALGITPDIIAKPKAVPAQELKWVEELYGKETALTNHITREEVEGKPAPIATPPIEVSDRPPLDVEVEFIKKLTNDYVIHAGLTMANVWTLGHRTSPMPTHDAALAFLKKTVVTEPFEVEKL